MFSENITTEENGFDQKFSEEPLPWESHLCNDALEVQIYIYIYPAEIDIQYSRKRYFIRTDASETELQLMEYLTTFPNESTEDNLSSLPEME